ncbi:peroxisomal biogenesis factor 11 [Rhizodiscina lignyota]|uniref:Peroxisomal biogenesis factor 11 n=1 Tax=Rhizodiscina lignyota TaxID=1504668 RepID=A0A9P4I9Y6_9PEZI|nr:peroxisomal biogenesis factor 11 [Rhizodiscina lignyota]
MVADAVIYHPTVSHYLKFVATTTGRDKVLRTLQYFARFYAWYLYRTNNPQSAIAPYDAIKKNFGLTRKILRFGKVVEHVKAAAIAADAKGGDEVLRVCAVGRQLGYAGYMFLDHLTMLDSAGIRPSPNAKRIQREAYKAWLAALTFSAVAGVYKLYGQQQRARTLNKQEAEGAVEVKKLERERGETTRQLISDLCDITVPTFALGYSNVLDDGLVGLAGTLSSILGLVQQWQKTA